MRIGVVVGNPKAQSRTLKIAERLAFKIDPAADVSVIDLVQYSGQMFNWPDDELAQLTTDVASQDLLIVGSPTYKASYTGLLKAFLDRYPQRGLENVFAVPLMTVASETHHMSADAHLRPLLIELGAIVPTSSLAFLTEKIDRTDKILDEWLDANGRALTLIRAAAGPRIKSNHSGKQ